MAFSIASSAACITKRKRVGLSGHPCLFKELKRPTVDVFALADAAKSHQRLAATYAACVNSSNVREICQDAAEDEPSPGGPIEVDLDINDVPGAYYFGTPAQPGEPGFRMLYGYVPKGLDEFGFPQYNGRGERRLYFIRGNAPGRRDAGQIWGKVYTQFLIGEGFVQSAVDRRVFYLKSANGRAIITTGVHVDDCISSARDRAAATPSTCGNARVSAVALLPCSATRLARSSGTSSGPASASGRGACASTARASSAS